MLTNSQEKLIKSLHTKKGRAKTGLCLVEGRKVLDMAKGFVEYTFTANDSKRFDKLVTTETPQKIAGVAKLPKWTIEDVAKNDVVIVLDHVQDPGNVGAILRLCLGFNASLILIESADPGNPKVIRSSAGALFQVPFVKVEEEDAEQIVYSLNKFVYRLEKRPNAEYLEKEFPIEPKFVLIAGSEGHGITLPIKGQSLAIPHSENLESLNVGTAVGMVLFAHKLLQ